MSATAKTLIHDLAGRGVHLTRHADCLRVEAAPGIVTPELRLVLSERKEELLAALSADSIRDHLLRIAHTELIDAELIHKLPDTDVADCAGLDAAALRSYLHCLHDTRLRDRGKRPADETAPALCRHCGPVWIAPEVASVAPITAGWPRVLGCEWCHVKNRRAIPRPPVACGTCQRFARDTVNPAGGMGRCTANRKPLTHEPLPYPNASRQCECHEPENAA